MMVKACHSGFFVVFETQPAMQLLSVTCSRGPVTIAASRACVSAKHTTRSFVCSNSCIPSSNMHYHSLFYISREK